MPEYLYRDAAGHQQAVTHRMLYSTGVTCLCGRPMHRVPQAARLNWNGGRAVHELPYSVRRVLATVDQRRDALAKAKEGYDRVTVQNKPEVVRKPSA